MADKLRVLVVDDAAFMIKAVSELLASDPTIEVVGTARNGREGLAKIHELQPDVVTLDIDMPVMDGITSIRHIMIEAPVPIVVLSSLYNDGAITFEALRLGVVDFLPKPSGAISRDIHQARQQLIDRVKLAAAVNLHNVRRVRLNPIASPHLDDGYGFQSLDHLLVIGTTLGGPNTALRLFGNLTPKLPAAAIVMQEIAPRILPAFAAQFDEHVPWKVEVARDRMVLEQGTCYIASREQTITVELNEDRAACLRVSMADAQPLNRLFDSAIQVFEQNTVGVLLTGVGNDGSDGFAAIKRKAGITIAQQVETCVYPNLTRCAIERGVVDHIVEEDQLAAHITAAMQPGMAPWPSRVGHC